MDPVLKAGLPKLFVLEGRQSAEEVQGSRGQKEREGCGGVWNILLKECR